MLPTQCLCTKLRRAARSVSRFYDEALADTGLKVAQFSLLRHLQRLTGRAFPNSPKPWDSTAAPSVATCGCWKATACCA